MPLQAFLTVDLDGGVTKPQRDEFDSYLKKQGFEKRKLTTLYTVDFTAESTKEGADAFVHHHVNEAARLAGISHFEAAFNTSETALFEWTKGVSSKGLGLAGMQGYSRLRGLL